MYFAMKGYVFYFMIRFDIFKNYDEQCNINMLFSLVSLLNGILTFVGYLMPKPSF